MTPSPNTKDSLVRRASAEWLAQKFGPRSVVNRRLFLSFGRTKSCNQPMRNLQSAATELTRAVQQRFASGVVLYDGEAAVPFGKNLYAVPISVLWEKS